MALTTRCQNPDCRKLTRNPAPADCPHCGEPFDVLVQSVQHQIPIEDLDPEVAIGRALRELVQYIGRIDDPAVLTDFEALEEDGAARAGVLGAVAARRFILEAAEDPEGVTVESGAEPLEPAPAGDGEGSEAEASPPASELAAILEGSSRDVVIPRINAIEDAEQLEALDTLEASARRPRTTVRDAIASRLDDLDDAGEQ